MFNILFSEGREEVLRFRDLLKLILLSKYQNEILQSTIEKYKLKRCGEHLMYDPKENEKCELCKKETPLCCISTCNYCYEDVCSECSFHCELCLNFYCNKCVERIECDKCADVWCRVCDDEIISYQDWRDTLCQKHLKKCDGCDDWKPKDHFVYCDGCSREVCGECMVEDDLCEDCNEERCIACDIHTDNRCRECGNYICDGCSNDGNCANHYAECDHCYSVILESELEYCYNCGKNICSDCNEDDK